MVNVMSEILPGVYVQRKEGSLVSTSPVGLNTLAVVGTANRGPINEPVLLKSIQHAYSTFGFPDEFDSTAEGEELSLTRAVQIAYDAGASQIYAVRVASDSAAKATRIIESTSGDCVELKAASEGEWGNDLFYKVEIADGEVDTDYHVAKHFGQVDEDATDALTDSSPFPYYELSTGSGYNAIASVQNSVELTYSAGTGTAVDMDIIHSDAHVFKESGEVDSEVADDNNDWFSQTFTTRDACTVEGVRLRMAYVTGVPSGDYTVEIYEVDAAGEPNTSGTAIAESSDTFASLSLGTSYSTELFTFDSSVDLLADTKYAIVVSGTGVDGSHEFKIGGLTAAGTDTYTRGEAFFSSDGGSSWSESSNVEDFLFDLDITIPENHCVFVINDWGTTWPGGGNRKHLRWSGDATPLNDTYIDMTYYTSESRKVSIKYGSVKEEYWVVSGDDLVNDVTDSSSLVTAVADSNSSEEPSTTTGWQQFGLGSGTMGVNGATDVSAADYGEGFDELEQIYVHVVTAAGRVDRATISDMVSHVESMSESRMERFCVAGHAYGLTLAETMEASGAFASARLAYVSPGIKKTNVNTGEVETLNAGYTAAYLAGWLCRGDISESNLYKSVNVAGLEKYYTEAEAGQLASRRINPIMEFPEGGYRWKTAWTTSTSAGQKLITTIRIGDYATYGIRTICNKFIGNKNLPGNRGAIRTAIKSFLERMEARDMLRKDSDEKPFSVRVDPDDDDPTRLEVVVHVKPVAAIEYIDVIEYIE